MRECKKTITTDLCVIGGGLAGVCAAVTAARRGVRVVLLQDRPVLGGNSSGEVRMWVRGASANFPEHREGGIIEELALEVAHHNPDMNFSVWDGILYNKVIYEKNITLYLNTTCIGAREKDGRITSVTAWQLTTYTRLTVRATAFADCSGDSVLANFTDASYRVGREAQSEFGEALAHEKADTQTMGNSCLIQARETDHHVSYTPPEFAYHFRDGDMDNRLPGDQPDFSEKLKWENFWWLEIGGEGDSLRDAGKNNRDLIAYAFGVWDYIKNSGRYNADNWELDWVGFLAGKRESRRYVGDVILTENDIEQNTPFDDEIAYGGWNIDDHPPKGLFAPEGPNRVSKFPAPYRIPYRATYSANVDNLWFAGRNVSVTHLALSSTRVMATCAMIGHAVGCAASLAKKYHTTPRGVGEHIAELQQVLRDDDCFLTSVPRRPRLNIENVKTDLTSDELLRLTNGIERRLNDETAPVCIRIGQPLTLEFAPTECRGVRLIFDSDLPRDYLRRDPVLCEHVALFPMRSNLSRDMRPVPMPPSLVRAYTVEVKSNGKWRTVKIEDDNFRRHAEIPVRGAVEGIRLTCRGTWGSPDAAVFSVDIV